ALPGQAEERAATGPVACVGVGARAAARPQQGGSGTGQQARADRLGGVVAEDSVRERTSAVGGYRRHDWPSSTGRRAHTVMMAAGSDRREGKADSKSDRRKVAIQRLAPRARLVPHGRSVQALHAEAEDTDAVGAQRHDHGSSARGYLMVESRYVLLDSPMADLPAHLCQEHVWLWPR